MDQPDIVKFLATFGFEGLSLIDNKDHITTYKYTSLNPKLLKKLGESTVTSNGKTAVYNLPGVASIGYLPSKNLVRFVYKGKARAAVKNQTVDHEVIVTPELHKMFMQVQVNPGKAVAFCKKLWHYFNEHKFNSVMQEPTLLVSPTPPHKTNLKNARGIYFSRCEGEPGTLWMNTKVFNATEQVFLTIFLHEMCHQACNQISRLSRAENSIEKGHGPVWKQWMVKVGLNPSRYDHTDEIEYGTAMDRAKREASEAARIGPRITPESFKGKRKVTEPEDRDRVIFEHEGRVASGVIEKLGKAIKMMDPTFRHPLFKTVYLENAGPVYYADDYVMPTWKDK